MGIPISVTIVTPISMGIYSMGGRAHARKAPTRVGAGTGEAGDFGSCGLDRLTGTVSPTGGRVSRRLGLL